MIITIPLILLYQIYKKKKKKILDVVKKREWLPYSVPILFNMRRSAFILKFE